MDLPVSGKSGGAFPSKTQVPPKTGGSPSRQLTPPLNVTELGSWGAGELGSLQRWSGPHSCDLAGHTVTYAGVHVHADSSCQHMPTHAKYPDPSAHQPQVLQLHVQG